MATKSPHLFWWLHLSAFLPCSTHRHVLLNDNEKGFTQRATQQWTMTTKLPGKTPAVRHMIEFPLLRGSGNPSVSVYEAT